nr:MAG TPA: hypothetical protein [Caudoviricetes sp.]
MVTHPSSMTTLVLAGSSWSAMTFQAAMRAIVAAFMGGPLAAPGADAPGAFGWSEGVECVCVEASHDGQPGAEVAVQVAAGGAVVGEAPLVDVLEDLLVAEGEGPPGEGVACRVSAGGGVQLGGLQGGGGVGVHVRFLSVGQRVGRG